MRIFGKNLWKTTPIIATQDKNNKVALTSPKQKNNNSFFLNFSFTIFEVNTLPQKVIVTGLD